MHPILKDLIEGIPLTGDIAHDMVVLQTATGHANVAEHCQRVSAEAVRLAERFGADSDKARIAGLLHDISDIIPLSQAVHAAREFGLKLFPEEEHFPMILHQRLSVVVAQQVFHVKDAEVLGAIECHTALKANANLLEKIVFIADKIEWDQPRENPYLAGIQAALADSLDSSLFFYVNALWQDRENLMVLHPWLKDAYEDFSANRSTPA
jgi:predicted HD superfamily hydrolase involved in NAD metabolism